jgi:hypothetical protein
LSIFDLLQQINNRSTEEKLTNLLCACGRSLSDDTQEGPDGWHLYSTRTGVGVLGGGGGRFGERRKFIVNKGCLAMQIKFPRDQQPEASSSGHV